MATDLGGRREPARRSRTARVRRRVGARPPAVRRSYPSLARELPTGPRIRPDERRRPSLVDRVVVPRRLLDAADRDRWTNDLACGDHRGRHAARADRCRTGAATHGSGTNRGSRRPDRPDDRLHSVPLGCAPRRTHGIGQRRRHLVHRTVAPRCNRRQRAAPAAHTRVGRLARRTRHGPGSDHRRRFRPHRDLRRPAHRRDARPPVASPRVGRLREVAHRVGSPERIPPVADADRARRRSLRVGSRRHLLDRLRAPRRCATDGRFRFAGG